MPLLRGGNRLSLKQAAQHVLTAVVVVGGLCVIDRFLPLNEFADEHPLLGRVIAFGVVACVVVVGGLLFARRPFWKAGDCPNCGRAFTSGYVDYDAKTIRCEGCGQETPVAQVFDRDEFAGLAEAMLREQDMNAEQEAALRGFIQEVMESYGGPGPPATGLDMDRTRNVCQLVAILVSGGVGAVVGGVLGGWLHAISGAFAGVVFGLLASGAVLMVRGREPGN